MMASVYVAVELCNSLFYTGHVLYHPFDGTMKLHKITTKSTHIQISDAFIIHISDLIDIDEHISFWHGLFDIHW